MINKTQSEKAAAINGLKNKQVSQNLSLREPCRGEHVLHLELGRCEFKSCFQRLAKHHHLPFKLGIKIISSLTVTAGDKSDQTCKALIISYHDWHKTVM